MVYQHDGKEKSSLSGCQKLKSFETIEREEG